MFYGSLQTIQDIELLEFSNSNIFFDHDHLIHTTVCFIYSFFSVLLVVSAVQPSPAFIHIQSVCLSITFLMDLEVLGTAYLEWDRKREITNGEYIVPIFSISEYVETKLRTTLRSIYGYIRINFDNTFQ